MEKVILFFAPGRGPKHLLSGLFIILIFILVTTQIWMHINTERGVENTLSGILEDESCKVLKTTSVVESGRVRTITEVTCTKSGRHDLSRGGIPDYFRKESDELRAISSENYRS